MKKEKPIKTTTRDDSGFKVIRGQDGKIQGMELKGKRYNFPGRIIVERSDFAPVSLSDVPPELRIEFPEDTAPGFRIKGIVYTRDNMTDVECLFRNNSSDSLSPRRLMRDAEAIYLKMLGERGTKRDVKMHTHYVDEKSAFMAFTVAISGRTFHDVFQKVEKWFDDLVLRTVARSK